MFSYDKAKWHVPPQWGGGYVGLGMPIRPALFDLQRGRPDGLGQALFSRPHLWTEGDRPSLFGLLRCWEANPIFEARPKDPFHTAESAENEEKII